MMSHEPSPPLSLLRILHLPQAILLGLGSMLGTGVFVGLGVAAGLVSGAELLLGLAVAALLALCNGLSSAQLAARMPVSGGTYEYAYRKLNPLLGFSAGWLFLCAKSASAAGACLGLSGYILTTLNVSLSGQNVLAAGLAAFITTLALLGLKRSAQVNLILVGVAGSSLAAFALWFGWPSLNSLVGEAPFSLPRFLEATALLFVAYTGYGRLATLGEEIVEPRRTIPLAILWTVAACFAIYATVALAALKAASPAEFASLTRQSAAPLEALARLREAPVWLQAWLGAGALCALSGVVLNLVLGLSRVVLAMSRNRDLPEFLARLSLRRVAPQRAVLFSGALILAFTLVFDFKANWSFSAFTVLIYYGLTHMAALRLGPEERFFPPGLAIAGLVGCLGLAPFLEPEAVAWGALILAAGWGLRFAFLVPLLFRR